MNREKILGVEKTPNCTLSQLIQALNKAGNHARIATPKGQLFGGGSTITVEDSDGWNLTGVAMVEKTLSDGSKVFTARLMFDSLAGL